MSIYLAKKKDLSLLSSVHEDIYLLSINKLIYIT